MAGLANGDVDGTPPGGHVRELRPDQVRDGPWTVRLTIAGPACDREAEYRWEVDGEKVAAERLNDCSYAIQFPKEGSYRVTLDAALDGDTASKSQTVTVQDWLIVSTGDSVASGESVPDEGSPFAATWQSARCHRSRRAAAAKTAQALEEADEHSSVTFLHLACSGATVERGMVGGYAGAERTPNEPDLVPQVDVVNEIAEDRRVDALLISVGANDVHFGDVVRFCASPGRFNCFRRKALFPGTSRAPLEEIVGTSLVELKARYDKLESRLSKRIPRANVHLVEYFDPTRNGRGETCRRILGGISRREAADAHTKLLAPLNRTARDAAGRHRWDFIEGPSERFRTHGYCAGRDSWVTSLGESATSLGGRLRQRFLGTLHPNEAGHYDTSLVLLAALSKQIGAERPVPPAPVATQDVVDLNENSGDGDGDGSDGLAWYWLLAGAWAFVTLVAGAVFLWRRSNVEGIGGGPCFFSTPRLLIGPIVAAVLAVVLRDDGAVALPFALAAAVGFVGVPIFRVMLIRDEVRAERRGPGR